MSVLTESRAGFTPAPPSSLEIDTQRDGGGLSSGLIARMVVHFDVALCSQNRACKLRDKMRAKKQARKAGWEAWIEAGRPTSSVPVNVRLINCRTRTMDEFNFGGACKHIVDGIFVKALTPDDSPEWVHFLPIEQRPDKSNKSDPTVIVEVYKRGEA